MSSRKVFQALRYDLSAILGPAGPLAVLSHACQRTEHYETDHGRGIQSAHVAQGKFKRSPRNASPSPYCFSMFSHILTFFLMFLPSGPPSGAHASATGNLTVTAVVTSSVSVTFDSDGRPVMVVANAPADADAIALASKPFDKTTRNRDHKPIKGFANRNKKKTKGVKHASVR